MNLIGPRRRCNQMADNEYDVASFDVLELARDSGCTAYDCEFVALARRLDVKLVTGDAKLRKAFPGLTVPLRGIDEWAL